MQSLARDGYTEEEVKKVLHGAYGSRVVKFRYDLLNRDETKKGELERVVGASVSMSALSTIKRTAKFTLEEEKVNTLEYYKWSGFGDKKWNDLGANLGFSRWNEAYTTSSGLVDKIDWLNGRIQPFVMFQMPDGGWIEFSMGIFILSTPTRKDSNGYVTREVEAYDGLVVLQQDKFTDRWTVKAGTTYEAAVANILKSAGITKYNLQFTGNTKLPLDKEFAMGTSKLDAIGELLDAKNNTPLWVDAYGYYNTSPYQAPNSKGYSYTYETNDLSVIYDGISEEFDIFDTPNSWVVTLSNPESTPLTSRTENNNVDSPTSIPNRGRRIVDYREVQDISSQADLDAYTQRIAFEASQVYGKVKFSTPIMPFHEYADVIRFVYNPLEVDNVFSETGWSIDMSAGGTMTHEVRRVVEI